MFRYDVVVLHDITQVLIVYMYLSYIFFITVHTVSFDHNKNEDLHVSKLCAISNPVSLAK